MEESKNLKQRVETYLQAKFSERKELSVAKIDRLTGGYSYETYFLTISWQVAEGSLSEDLVVSMEPEYGIAPPYDVRRQYEVLKGLHGTGIPAPKAFLLETDSQVLGRPFFIMEKVEGENLDTYFPSHPAEQEQLRKAYAETIARLHDLDWQALGLSVLGVPGNDREHAEKEIAKCEQVLKNNQFTPQPVMAEIFSWLKKNIPRAERTTLCHGDVKVGVAGNFLARDGAIAALLDWELVGIGDPLSDLGYASLVMQNGTFWNKADFIRTYEEIAGVTVNEESLFFWEVFTYVKWIVMGYPGVKSGLTSKDLNVQLLAANTNFLPWMKNSAARKLGF